ncbi:MAG: regulatory protein RecX [Acidobacteriaceae bacterium]
MEFSSARARKPKQPLDEAALYESAVRSLASKMRTVAELKRLLRARVEPGESGEAKVEAVIARLKERRYLNDTRYANEYARLRQENEKFGKRRVQQDLAQRGVHREIISKTLDALYDDIPEETQLRRFLERKRLRQPQNDKETARIVRMLVRAGFRTATIFQVLKQWNVKEDVLADLENMDTGPDTEKDTERLDEE